MSGNVSEWTFTGQGGARAIPGGNYSSDGHMIQLGRQHEWDLSCGDERIGFRIIKAEERKTHDEEDAASLDDLSGKKTDSAAKTQEPPSLEDRIILEEDYDEGWYEEFLLLEEQVMKMQSTQKSGHRDSEYWAELLGNFGFLSISDSEMLRMIETILAPRLQLMPPFKMVQIPEGRYRVPLSWENDRGTVYGGFEIGETVVTYALWYFIRTWAEDNGYYFRKLGREGGGSFRNFGGPPTDRGNEPVTCIAWPDAIVWCNALSEYSGLEPVYRSISGEIIRDSREENAHVVMNPLIYHVDGYRLPTIDEWVMAARWLGTEEPSSDFLKDDFWGAVTTVNNDITYYWHRANHISGQIHQTWTDEFYYERDRLAVHRNNAERTPYYCPDQDDMIMIPKTSVVKNKLPNALGLYDMCGNIGEFTMTEGTIPETYKLKDAGDYYNLPERLASLQNHGHNTGYGYNSQVSGFRLARGSLELY